MTEAPVGRKTEADDPLVEKRKVKPRSDSLSVSKPSNHPIKLDKIVLESPRSISENQRSVLPSPSTNGLGPADPSWRSTGSTSRGSSRSSSRASSRYDDDSDSETPSIKLEKPRGSVKSPTYDYKQRSCLGAPLCYSRPKPTKTKRFSRMDRKFTLNTIDGDIFINEEFPLEIGLETTQGLSADLKLSIDLYDTSTNKRIKEPVLEYDSPALMKKGFLAITLRMKINKLALEYDAGAFYFKIRGDHTPSLKSNQFNVIARYRVVFVGDTGVGKSWLIDEYLNDITHVKKSYGDDGSGLDSRLLGGEGDIKRARSGEGKIMREIKFQVEVQGKPVHILLFDTSGDKNFRNQLFVLNQETDFVLLCFSVVDYHSYDSLTEWKEEILKLAPKASFGVVGLKKDIRDNRDSFTESKAKPDILEDWGFSWANRNEAAFYAECSTKDRDSIEAVFKKVLLHLTGGDRKVNRKGDNRSCSTCVVC